MQLSDTYVGDQLTVVDQLARSMAGQGLVDKRRDLEHDALPPWKLVQLAVPSARNQPGSSVPN